MDVGQGPVQIVDVGQPKLQTTASKQQSRFGYVRVEVTDAQRLAAFDLLRLAEHCCREVDCHDGSALPREAAGDPSVAAGNLQHPLSCNGSHEVEKRNSHWIVKIVRPARGIEVRDFVIPSNTRHALGHTGGHRRDHPP
jgi:hypothetical protein